MSFSSAYRIELKRETRLLAESLAKSNFQSGMINAYKIGMSEEIVFDRSFNQAPGAVTQVSGLVRRIVCDNGGAFTFTGTCSYILGAGDVIVLDPGPDDAAHITRLLEATAKERIVGILVSHSHADHSPGARLLQARCGAPIFGCAQHVAARALHLGEVNRLDASVDRLYRPDHVLSDGEMLDLAGLRLETIATPGHTMNHLCFALAQEQALFSADHVMAWATTIVAPPDGSMRAYMQSLEKLRGRSETIYWPGHGGPVNEPQRFLRALLHHRRSREAAILHRLQKGDSQISAIVARLYVDLDPRLRGAAALSVFAHLEMLIEQGLARSEGEPSLTSNFSAV